jgi:short subunit dehydrogenase-like uncharacterized protein
VMADWMIYGANGFTGRLMAIEAAQRGMRPVLAGRNRSAIESLAAELGLTSCVVDLGETEKLKDALQKMKLVMHCAGPFSATSQPMIAACLASQTHYLDITGEISVFENAWKMDDAAKRADVLLCPGAGFDVVPTDCLAARLVEALPSATSLTLAFEPGGGPSPGTAKTSLEGMSQGGRVRRAGKLTKVPLAWKTRNIPFQHADRAAVTIPWGDVFTAWVSTGVPDIEVYLSLPAARIQKLRRMRFIQPLFKYQWLQNFLKKRIEKNVPGPDQQLRTNSQTQLWGEVVSVDGRSVSATMQTPNGYDITVTAGLGIVEHLLENEVTGGYMTPSLLMGSGYAESLPGVSIQLTEQKDA